MNFRIARAAQRNRVLKSLSVLEQSYPDVDILVRDDGSTDDTFVILKEYEEMHPNIRAYQGENIGVNRSFFELLRKSDARAAYIGFCDQDDYWLPEKIERAVEKLKRYDAPALYCGAKTLVDENLERLSEQQIGRASCRERVF